MASGANVIEGAQRLVVEKIRHPKSDPLAQEEWKKTPRNPQRNRPRMGRRQTRQTDVSGRGAVWPYLGRAQVLGTLSHRAYVPSHADSRVHLCLWSGGCMYGRVSNIYLLKLPPYAPDLNPIEHVWDELREKFFHNRAFDSLDALEDQLMLVLTTLEKNPETVRTIVSWDWIVSSLITSFMK
jgi:hypothetical protein